MYIINFIPFKAMIPETMKKTIQKARRNKEQWVLVEESYGPDYITRWERVDAIEKVTFERGTKIYDRRTGYPFKVIKEAVKILHKYDIPVEDCFDGNHDRVNSSIDNYCDESHFDREALEKIGWAISALQWAGFNDPEVLCAYDAPIFAYVYEAKLR